MRKLASAEYQRVNYENFERQESERVERLWHDDDNDNDDEKLSFIVSIVSIWKTLKKR